MRDFRYLPGSNLLDRVHSFYDWQELRRGTGLWPLGRSTETGPRSKCVARTDEGELFEGINFASQDYLSLSAHSAISDVAIETIKEFGVHSAGSPALVGNTSLSLALERKIADFLQMEQVTLFPTGWAAGFGVVKGLVRPSDHIVMDALSHACLQEGAQASTRNIHLFRHNNLDSVREKLTAIRAKDKDNGILVITESLFSMDSDTPDIARLQELAHKFGAILLVDVAHDLGALGPDGRGHIGMQNMIGKVDVVMGSFSKTFASNGGFVACNTRSVKEYLKYYSSPCTFSNALSPSQAAIVLKAFEIVDSEEGATLRQSLMNNIRFLRELLHGTSFETYGDPSPIVCVQMGSEGLARLVARRLPDIGLLANLVEFPAVPKGQARFRMQVMAGHSSRNIIDSVHRLSVARDQAQIQFDALQNGTATFDTIDAVINQPTCGRGGKTGPTGGQKARRANSSEGPLSLRAAS
ncbi:aminotransferase class I/II-fold pyridoxal phosphate-dependent enzyme [Sphingomonas parva]|uniref:Aminotransferase class I/II-fold pyridoxal phosphate-dependent enzyme n=1 Tax=Sphingomonas parva TaxID=2555898 RepID=A0A4Y8ZMB2_9SPHN|nr:aminotransferase class I/II-fold pyridoxal phosphate-dependent enzyme [Sphingomonas parva]TFI57131.1 aminotransferase class I/II-fold pyridoxal phosphate-dependent enzyme [Sphingomonas parva]